MSASELNLRRRETIKLSVPSHEIGDDDMWALEEIFWRIISVLVSSRPRVWINHWSVLGQDRSDTKKSVLVLEAVVLVLQFWCFL